MLAAIPTPPVHDLHLGSLTLHLYGLILGVAIVIGVWVGERNMPVVGRRSEELLPIGLPAIVAGLVGARLYHVASQPNRYASHPGEIIQIWNGGLGIYGAVLAGALGAWAMARRRGVPIAAVLDACAPAVVFAQALGRWGNYVNQELFGRPTKLPWALHVDAQFRPTGFAHATTFHPTFLYESLACFTIGVALMVALRRWRNHAPGAVFAAYVAAYAVVRFFIEELRIDAAHHWLGLRQNQWVSLAIAVIALAVFARLQQRHRSNTAATKAL